MDLDTILQLAGSSLRLATPLLLACLAGLYSERAGIFDIGLEGKMLAAAFAAGAFAAVTGSAWIGLLAGIAASCALALLHGLASITLKGNQLISGVAINFLASGLTALIGQNWFGMGGQTPQLEPATSASCRWNGRFVETLAPVPVIGPIYQHLISGHNILVYLALLAVPATWWVLYRTRFGLRLRAVGENPGAVDTAGVSVVRLRYAAVLIAGLLCGIAGAYLSTGMAAGFIREMTAGKGFIALAALIFAKWRPWPALGACLLFGFLEAIGIRYQGDRHPRRRRGAGAVHAGAALHPDRHHPRRLRRQGDPAQGRRPALRQGALMEAARDHPRPRRRRARSRSASCSGSGLGHLTERRRRRRHRLRRPARAFRTPASPATSRGSSSATSKACGSPCSAAGPTTTRRATRAVMRRPLETLRALGAETPDPDQRRRLLPPRHRRRAS